MVLDVKNSTLPVLISVMLILYSLITPFWSSEGGGSQERYITVELGTVPVNCCGGLVGTGLEKKKKRKNMALIPAANIGSPH